MQTFRASQRHAHGREDLLTKFAETDTQLETKVEAKPASRFQWLNWSSLLFAFIQSVCTAFLALSGLRLLIGAAAFASALGVLKVAERLHGNDIRIPMMVIALVGAVINLVGLWQVWRLRRRPASSWRQAPVPAAKRRSEWWQLTLSLLTLLLLAAETLAHWKVKG
jgi:hypothetical protein